jgi:hypothetical protein
VRSVLVRRAKCWSGRFNSQKLTNTAKEVDTRAAHEGALAGGFALIGVPVADVVTVSILYGLTAPAIGLIYGVVALAQGEKPLDGTTARLGRDNDVEPKR